MIDVLTRRKLFAVDRQDADRVLRAGPWCWPAAADAAALRRARAIAGRIPALDVGDAPLVTVSPVAVTLWRLQRCGRNAGSHAGARVFGATAERGWHEAAAALPRVLPFLWASVAEARDAEICAIEVTSDARRGSRAAVSHPCAIDGESFGVSFLLALASKVIGRALPVDLVASAAIDPEGRVHPVGEIFDKVSFLVKRAPRVRRILVHPENADEATRGAAGTAVDVVSVATGGDAVEAAFGRDLGKLLVGLGAEPGSRAAMVDAFFRLALSGRAQTVDWSPVGDAAALALRKWKDLVPGDRYRLELARAVAARREHNEGEIKAPDPDWLSQLPLPWRLRVLSSLVLQAAEAGSPDPDGVERSALAQLVRGGEAFAEHLQLQVALGRLCSVTGRTDKALAFVREAVAGLVQRDELGRIGFPLAELYRLAAVERNEDAFSEAERTRESLRQRAALTGADAAAVDLFRLRWKIEQRLAGGDDLAVLGKIAARADVCAQVRYSALRCLARWLGAAAREDEAREILTRMDEAGANGNSEAETARTFAALCRIDAANAVSDFEAAAEALNALRREDGGLLRNLECADRTTSEDLAVVVAREYPD